MQDNWQDFDRHLKSVMQNAEEKAPRRVWRAVSSRLDSAAAAAAWWKWALPAFAAAALVAGLFFSGIFDKQSNLPGDIKIIADSGVQSPAAPASLASLQEEPSPAPAGEVLEAPAPVRKMRSAKPQAPISAVSREEDQPAEVLPSGPESAASEAQGSPAAVDKKSPKESTDNVAEQWARIAREESGKASGLKISKLYAQGGLGGNDSNISYGGTGISRMAPGAGSADAGISESGPSAYGIPFTVGLGIRFRLADKLSLGTGLQYSLLTRTFQGSYTGGGDSFSGDITHNLSYIGIPVNVYYNLLSTRDGLMDVYAWGGGSAELCVANNYRLHGASGSVIPDKAGSLQFSAALGIGLQFKLTDRIGLYLDPAVRYYFHGAGQPKSIRSDKPFMFNFDAGLRFDL